MTRERADGGAVVMACDKAVRRPAGVTRDLTWHDGISRNLMSKYCVNVALNLARAAR
jgi:hypothetical protein